MAELEKVFIRDLSQLTQPQQLLGKVLEFEGVDSSGKPVSFQASTGLLLQAMGQSLPGPNNRADLLKVVRYYNSSMIPAGSGADSALNTLDPAFLCLHCQCLVEFGPDGNDQTYVLSYDPSGPLQVWRDATFALGGKVPARWIKKDSPQAATAGIPAFNAATASYAQAAQVTYDSRIFESLQVLNKIDFGGSIPSPLNMTYWKEISKASTTVLFQRLGTTLLKDLQSEEQLQPSRLYIAVRRPEEDEFGNTVPGTGGTLYIRAADSTLLEAEGEWLNPDTGLLEPVGYDLATDTITPRQDGGGYTDVQAVEAVRQSGEFATRQDLLAGAVVFPMAGGSPRFYPTAQQACDAAADGDSVRIVGTHSTLNVQKTLHVTAYGARFTGQVVLFWQAWYDRPSTTTWRGGVFEANLFCGRNNGTGTNQIRVWDIRLEGPSAFLQSHTNNTANPGPNDQYSFYNCHITHVVFNQLTGYDQRQSLYFSACTFKPHVSTSALFRGAMHPDSVITCHHCRFEPTAAGFFDTPSTLGRLQLHGLTTRALEAGVSNLLSDGLRVLTSANPFAVAPTPEALYPAGGGPPVVMPKLNLKVATTAAQQDDVVQGTGWPVPFSTVVRSDNADPATVLSGSAIVVPRACTGILSMSLVLKNCVVGGFYQVFLFVKRRQSDGSFVTESVVVDFVTAADGGTAVGVLGGCSRSTRVSVGAGDQLAVAIYATNPASLRGQYPGSECTLSFIED